MSSPRPVHDPFVSIMLAPDIEMQEEADIGFSWRNALVSSSFRGLLPVTPSVSEILEANKSKRFDCAEVIVPTRAFSELLYRDMLATMPERFVVGFDP